MTARSGATVRSGLAIALALVSLGFDSPGAAPRRVAIPLICSRGPSGQEHDVTVTVPSRVPRGSRYKVRVDGVETGKISHSGLNYIFDIWSEWAVPAGTTYVEGSARLVPDTGSANVRPGARVVHGVGRISLVLPAHVENGASYTPPTFEFELNVTSPEGASITQWFSGYHVTANAFLVGNVRTSCEPSPKPYPVAVTRVESGP
jgi:hypothetical protein